MPFQLLPFNSNRFDSFYYGVHGFRLGICELSFHFVVLSQDDCDIDRNKKGIERNLWTLGFHGSAY